MAISLVGTPTGTGASAAVTSIACTVPTGATTSTYLVWTVNGNNVTSPTADPAGWTRLQFTSVSGENVATWGRFHDGSSTSYTSPTLTSAITATSMVAFGGVDTTTPLDVAMPTGTTGTTAWTFPAITPVTTGAWVVAVGGPQLAAAVTTGTITSSNLSAVDVATWSTNAASAVHVAACIGHLGTWASGAFTPAMASSAVTAHTIGQSLALRPATTTTTAPRRPLIVQQAVQRAATF